MIIAIGGSYGSGGKRLAIHLSEILGYTLCDDVIAEAINLVVTDPVANSEKAKALVKSLTDRYPLHKG